MWYLCYHLVSCVYTVNGYWQIKTTGGNPAMNCHPSLKGTGTLQVALCDWNQDKQQPYVSQLMARDLPFFNFSSKTDSSQNFNFISIGTEGPPYELWCVCPPQNPGLTNDCLESYQVECLQAWACSKQWMISKLLDQSEQYFFFLYSPWSVTHQLPHDSPQC